MLDLKEVVTLKRSNLNGVEDRLTDIRVVRHPEDAVQPRLEPICARLSACNASQREDDVPGGRTRVPSLAPDLTLTGSAGPVTEAGL